MSGTPAFRVKNLSVAFGALKALSNVCWDAHAGEILAVIGPNGAGKSTCFEAATNMVSRTGKVLLDGLDITDLPSNQLAVLGVRRGFQQNAFFGDMTVLENMTGALLRSYGTSLASSVFAPLRARHQRLEAAAAAAAVLDRFTIPRSAYDVKPAEMPYGVQRMLSLALAYGEGAKVMLLDEPGAGLGGEDMIRLSQLLRILKSEGVAIVLVEHHMDLVMAVSDRIVVLNRGEVLATGTPEDIQSNRDVLEAYLGVEQ